MAAPPVVVHVPHASVAIPPDVARTLLLGGADLERELLAMTDRYTDELFELPAETAARVVFPVSRLVVDPERFADDAEEMMAARGMGVVYTRTSDGRPLRRAPTARERESLLERFYRPHHAALERAVSAALAVHGRCLVIDAHSFPSRPLPYEEDQGPDRPEVCLGTDPFHTPERLRHAALESFGARWRVAIDRPFTGALVPMPWYRRDRQVESILVELNRGLYMDEATGARLPHFDDLGRALAEALRPLVADAAAHA